MTNWEETSMASALKEVSNGMSIRKAAEMFGVPKSTLSDRVTGKVKPDSTWGKNSHLTLTDEVELISAATNRADKGIGFSKRTYLR